MKIKVRITTAENMKFYGCKKDTIKEIELEDYVAIVVASEIGNAPLEACKAQAVASRTYAIQFGVLEGKAISDSAAKAQAFRAPRNNYDKCIQATKETEGMVLKYGGKYAGTYFCHSNGGRTYSSEEVWGGVRNYLVARKDDWTAATNQKKNGHGVGMSQVGAIYAANHGIGFKEILSFYYPKTTLAQIKISEYDAAILDEIRVRVEIALKTLKEGL